MQTIRITIHSGKRIHRDKSPDGWTHVPCSQVGEANICVKELACKQIRIGGNAGFVKQISKGIVIVGVCDGFGTAGQGARTPQSIIVIIRRGTISGLADEIVSIHISYKKSTIFIPFFQHLGIIPIGIHQIIGHNRAIKHLADAVAFGIVLVFDDDGDAKAGGFDVGQVIFGVIEVFDGLFRAGLFLEIAIVIIAVGDVVFLNQAVIVVIRIRCRKAVFGFRLAVADLIPSTDSGQAPV
jgi:hypothetical protein